MVGAVRVAVNGCAVVVLLASIALSQTLLTGAVTGTVTDPSGAVVPNATVTLRNNGTGATQTTTTTGTGAYRFTLLQPGAYTISVAQRGFQTVSRNAQVALGQSTTADLPLTVGTSSTTVEVTGAAPVVQADDANISTNITSQQVETMPNPGNDMTYVAATAPGVTINTSSGGGYGNFSTYGLPATSNLFTINGNDEMDPYLNLNNSGATNLLLGANEVQEVTVVSNGYTGQYGRQAGAQVDYVTKTGTNAFHGNASYWWNGRVLNANDWFANNTVPITPRPFVNNNQYAAGLSGPIKKDKVFFYVGTEGLRYILSTSNQIYVPTPAFQGAVLANLAGFGAPNSAPFYQNLFNIMNGAPGLNRATPVTDATDPSGHLGCGDLNTAGAGGPLPGFTQFGAGGLPCANTFRSTVGSPSSEWLLYGNVQFNMSDATRLNLRYKTDHGVQATYTDPFSPIFNANSVQPQHEGQLNLNHVFSPTVVNQFIASGSWYSAFFVVPDAARAQALFPGTLFNFDSPFGNSSDLRMVGGFQSSAPQGRNVTQYQFIDDVSINKGTHSIKVGGNFRRNDITNGIFGVRTVPRLRIFSTTDFVQGIIDQIGERFPSRLEEPEALYSVGAYIQDQWHVTPRLALTLTMRVDRNSNEVCQTNCFSRLVAPFTHLTHDPAIPYNQMIVTNLHRAFSQLQTVVPQPRFGFAYNLASNTVLRGGFGLFSDLYSADLTDPLARNSPSVNQFTLGGLPLSPAEPGNALSTIAACNRAFNTTFATGGTVSDFAAAAPHGCRAPDYTSIARKIYNPIYEEWNFEVQQALGRNTAIHVNYVGNRGYHEFVDNPFVNSFDAGGLGGLPTTPPDRRVRNVQQYYNGAESKYNGLTFSFLQRAVAGLQFQANYTWSHAIDEVSNGGVNPFSLNDSLLAQINPFNLRAQNYGNADYDVRHNVTLNYSWQTPHAFQGFLNHVVGGWTLSGTVFYHTGYPYTVIDTGAALGNGTGFVLGVSPLPDVLTTNVPLSCTHNPNTPCLSLAQFTPSGTETTFGNERRNMFRGPNYFNTDFSVLKEFKVTERLGLRLGANFYNLLNHPNFSNPQNDISSGSTFGLIQSTVTPPTSPYGAFVGSAVSGRIVQLHGEVRF